MNRIKKFSVLALIVISVLALTACSAKITSLDVGKGTLELEKEVVNIEKLNNEKEIIGDTIDGSRYFIYSALGEDNFLVILENNSSGVFNAGTKTFTKLSENINDESILDVENNRAISVKKGADNLLRHLFIKDLKTNEEKELNIDLKLVANGYLVGDSIYLETVPFNKFEKGLQGRFSNEVYKYDLKTDKLELVEKGGLLNKANSSVYCINADLEKNEYKVHDLINDKILLTTNFKDKPVMVENFFMGNSPVLQLKLDEQYKIILIDDKGEIARLKLSDKENDGYLSFPKLNNDDRCISFITQGINKVLFYDTKDSKFYSVAKDSDKFMQVYSAGDKLYLVEYESDSKKENEVAKEKVSKVTEFTVSENK